MIAEKWISVETCGNRGRECEPPRPKYKVQQIMTAENVHEERRGGTDVSLISSKTSHLPSLQFTR